MHLLLVSQLPGFDAKGQAAKLEFWPVSPTEVLQGATSWPHLVRAPSIAMLPADNHFEEGLIRVQTLLGQVLKPGSPAVAFGIRPEQTTEQTSPPPLHEIGGPSATAALAVGALWMLQTYLREDFGPLAEALAELHPDRVIVSADLVEYSQEKAADQRSPSIWRLLQVGYSGQKLELAHTFWTADAKLQLYMAPGQGMRGAGIHDEANDRPADLISLVVRMAEECGRGLTAAQRAVYLRLTSDKLPTSAQWRSATAPIVAAASLEAWLVRRAALHAADQSVAGAVRLPFGPPTQLLDHFTPVHLSLDDEDGPSVPMRPEQVLHSPEFLGVSVWAFQGPPFSGKSTLLAWWELRTAIAALKRLSDSPGSVHDSEPIEVCVLVDLGDLRLESKPNAQMANEVVQALVTYLSRVAGWMQFKGIGKDRRIQTPKMDPPPFGRHSYRNRKVAVRLLFDGLDTLSSLETAGRTRCIKHIIDWLALQDPSQVLPAVFAARSGLDLSALRGGRQAGWLPRTALLQPWTHVDWRAHLGTANQPGPARLPAEPLAALATMLGLDDDAKGSHDSLQQFCRLPGHLAGVCDLMRRQPRARLPDRPGQLLLALLWHLLAEPALKLDPPPPWLYGSLLAGVESAQASPSGWQLPAGKDCVLLRELVVQAAAMLTDEGLPIKTAASKEVAPELSATRRRQWLQAVQKLGLAREATGQFSFTHRPWHALFLALARNRPAMPLPDLAPPPLLFWRPDTSLPPAINWLNPRARPALPERTPHHDDIRMAADVASDPALWVQRLTPLNLPLAAQVAIDHRSRLEAGGPHPWLRLLRCLLLLRSLDAGTAALAAVQDSGMLDQAQASLGQDRELMALWEPARKTALQGAGRDLPERLDAALLLGMLGDTLRYQLIDPVGDAPPALRLHRRFWRPITGQGTAFYIAAFALTQGEWDSFLASPDALNPRAGCWQDAGLAAQAWLSTRQASAEPLAGLGLHRQYAAWGNPLLPVSGVSLHAARAYVAWARRHQLYDEWRLGQLDLPTEWEWQVAATHGGGPASQAGPLDFNHDELCWHRPSPVGIFSADWTGAGLADMRGNVRQWCSSALSKLDQHLPCAVTTRSDRAAPPDGVTSMAVRGSGFREAANRSGTQRRRQAKPDRCDHDLGLRLILRP